MRFVLGFLVLFGFMTNVVAQTVRPGDTLDISVWQDPKLDRKVVVTPDGSIALPLVGHLKAGGMTLQALESELQKRLQKNYTGQLDITVSLAATAPALSPEDDQTQARVFVTGEVARPGPYVIKPQTNIVQAITQAGGLGPFAARRRIQVHRQIKGGDSILLFDYLAFQNGTGTTDNINLRTGDIIIVPERGLFE